MLLCQLKAASDHRRGLQPPPAGAPAHGAGRVRATRSELENTTTRAIMVRHGLLGTAASLNFGSELRPARAETFNRPVIW
eukprot:765261-Hanusia_phi.AAC.2